MKIIICGVGRVGLSIARYLSMKGNDITIIDSDAQLIKRVSDTYDLTGIVGHASQPDILRAAGARDADILIAVTDNDEINMVACQVAHAIFNVPKKIARIRNKEYKDPAWEILFSRNYLSIDVIISPEEEIAESILKRMSVPGTTNDISLADDLIGISGLVIDSSNNIIDQTVSDLYFANKDLDFRIIHLIRDNKVINDFNDLTIQNGDEIYFMCEKSTLFELLSRLGNDNDIYSGNIIIAGGGVVGEALCQKIIQSPLFSKNNLFMIELNPQRAKQLDRNLERVIVLNGSALESEILNEANIGKSAVFVSVMNSIENNILSSVLAKKMGVNYSIALSNNALYDQLLSVKLVDSIVNPETITISRILFNLHKGHIRAIHSIRDTGIEIIEAKITENCGIVDTPIKELILKKNIQILSIYRSNTGEIEFIDEDSVIKPGDNIILSAYKVPEHEIEKLFSFSINLF